MYKFQDDYYGEDYYGEGEDYGESEDYGVDVKGEEIEEVEER